MYSESDEASERHSAEALEARQVRIVVQRMHRRGSLHEETPLASVL